MKPFLNDKNHIQYFAHYPYNGTSYVKTYIRVLCIISLSFCISLPASQAQQESKEKIDLLIEGSAAVEDELYELAQKTIEQFLQCEAKSLNKKLQAKLLLAQALHGQKKYQKMLELLLSAREQAISSSSVEPFLFWLATAYFETEQFSSALQCADEIEKRFPKSIYLPYILRLKAYSYWNMGNLPDAISSFALFAKKYGDTEQAYRNKLDWGNALMNSGNDAKAIEILQELLALNLNNSIDHQCRISLSSLYNQTGNQKKAREVIEPLLEQKYMSDELRASAVFQLSDIAQAQTNMLTALSVLETGIKQLSDPIWKGEANLRKGKLLIKMGKIDEGIDLVRSFVSIQSTNASAGRVQMELADTLFEKNLIEKALIEYQNYLEAFSDQAGIARANEGKGWALFRLRRYHEAIPSFKKAYDLSSGSQDKARCSFKIADCYFAVGQFDMAKKVYNQVMRECPETPIADQSQFQIAECEAQSGRSAEAEALFWKLIDDETEGKLAALALLRIAELKETQAKWQEANELYKLVIERYEPQAKAQAQHGLGIIQYRLGHFKEALKLFENVLQSYPDSNVADVACYMCGWCYYMLKQDVNALKYFKEFLKTYPQSRWAPHALFWTAEYQYNRGAYNEAEKQFLLERTNYPNSSVADTALFWAGRAALMQNEFRRAINHFSLLIQDYPNSKKRAQARFYQGESLCQLGEFAGAILIFDEIIKQFPNTYLAQKAWLRKGDSHFTLGSEDPKRYQEAIASYQTIMEQEDVSEEMKMEAEYKVGRCLEKLGQRQEAFEHYMKVSYTYFRNQDRSPESNIWFTRAAFNAAAMKEEEKSWSKAINIYQRVVDAHVPASRDASERIKKIQRDHWLFFY